MGRLTSALQDKLLKAGMRISVEEYLACAMAVVATGVVLAYLLLELRPSTAAVLLVIGTATAVYLPFRLAKFRAETAEAEIPYVMRTIASEVGAGVPYLQALMDGAKAGKILGGAIEDAISLYKKGIPMERALQSVGESIDSEKVRRAFLHFGILYQSGREATTIKKLADEMIAVHRAEAKRFSAELAMYTLVFVAVAALVPALFEMYVSIGSLFMSLTLSQKQAFYIPAVVFPALSAGVLLWVYLRIPSFMRR